MKNIIVMQQVHGKNVVKVNFSDNGKIIKECDGIITNNPKAVLSVHAADCLPLFFYSPTTNSIGVAHAGWRGLENGIIKETVRLLNKEFNVENKELIVFIGPHICQKHYEVGGDVAEKFSDYKNAIKKEKEKTFLDLGETAVLQLISMGVKKKNITVSGDCTFENKNLDSYRRKDMKRKTRYIFTIPDPS